MSKKSKNGSELGRSMNPEFRDNLEKTFQKEKQELDKLATKGKSRDR
ncbi:MAG: hypothetical protein SVV03_05880 [Candidatus Nanohaloarchaea archaeon]|nr:hypothetical protein [Candidatus Nanohaloarchaea archaeon]